MSHRHSSQLTAQKYEALSRLLIQLGVWELFVSSEKERAYPPSVAEPHKPGARVWSVDVLTGPSPHALDSNTFASVLANRDLPQYLHVKHLAIYHAGGYYIHMFFCSHPFSSPSSNSGLALRAAGDSQFRLSSWKIVSRGAAWDVAATRITGRVSIPQVGLFEHSPPMSVYFYHGAECLRSHEENPHTVSRPRGYSCAEIGGAFLGLDQDFSTLERLSALQPMFVSPWGTDRRGMVVVTILIVLQVTSRYIDVLQTEEASPATWEQGQSNGSQPLVGHLLRRHTIERILRGQ